MNKLFLVILAICLISTHAFVKRDAPTDTKGMDDINKFISKAAEDLKKAFDPDTLQKNFNQFSETVKSAFNFDQDKKPA